MDKINCNVVSCSHNKKQVCYANCVDIVGPSAQKHSDTSCSSFLDKSHYSRLTNNVLSEGSCDCLQCSVESCTYNSNHLCTLESIQVSGGENVDYYTHTACSSFKLEG
ncbi:hypothetical protein P22_2654 [Propionispora sp. 2/2-37]|uniref:DUF1540 domain-containing protein n=1 Tax=Propionispora sp. 2/2-37 TaxID=1677858 RepID=UPI0006BB8FC9|nr:DUF1540 domain-containing protein [Propionispora sp. 2/2-37]CUH96564.1 hypothetical protein P22_2654 [Propionispora sp. 2/2-37]